jgi:hypothetical protein
LQILGQGFDYFYLPTNQTRGGILLAWLSATWLVVSTSVQVFSISACFKLVAGGPPWWMNAVYGPCSDEGKPAFLA